MEQSLQQTRFVSFLVSKINPGSFFPSSPPAYWWADRASCPSTPTSVACVLDGEMGDFHLSLS